MNKSEETPLQINISLENVPAQGYSSGEDVSGKLVVTSSKEWETKGIKLKFLGRATVDWVTNGKRFHGAENYFELEKSIVDPGHTGLIIPIGESSYPFLFTLPSKTLPASYSGPNGKVEYTLVATTTASSDNRNLELSSSKAVRIHSPLDLRLEPGASMSSSQSKSQTSGLLCCVDGPVSMKASLGKSGFAPGQVISLSIEVQNQGKQNVEDVSFEIVETANYIAGTANSRTEKSVLYEMKGQPIARGETDQWRSEITVPKLPPSRLGGGCSIIDLGYMIKIETHSPKKGKNKIKLYFPIIIGTIPIR